MACNSSLSLDADDKVHMSYCGLSGGYYTLKYATNQNTPDWENQVLDSGKSVGAVSSIAVDPDFAFRDPSETQKSPCEKRSRGV